MKEPIHWRMWIHTLHQCTGNSIESHLTFKVEGGLLTKFTTAVAEALCITSLPSKAQKDSVA